MSRNTNKKLTLRGVLTKAQLIKVEKIMSCQVGKERRLDALREYYSKPTVRKRIARMGWHPDALAISTLTLSG
jgi:hypothetical protein